jgi:dTDP-4-dehydrorhamnose reductase
MRMLLIGASGQLGHALASAFATKHEVIASAYRRARPGQRVIDLGDPASLTAALHDTRPHVILIAGAQCNVDRCETEPAECERINVAGPCAVAQYARRHDAVVVYYSTDHVFEGVKARYTESDAIAPFNAYARSKADGEAAIRTLAPERHLILRTSWLYGPDPERRNFALRLVDRLRKGEMLKVPSDQTGCPTYTEDLAAATLALVDRGVAGTFHACGPDVMDRVALARQICRRFDMAGELVIATPTAELGQAAPRPRRVVMDCAKIQATIDLRFRGVERGLACLAGHDGNG